MSSQLACSNAVVCTCQPVFQPAAALATPSPPAPPTTFANIAQTATVHCPSGTTGSDRSFTQPANTFFSPVSQAEANGLAMAEATAQANALLSCTPTATTYYNVQQVATCPSGSHSSPVTWPNVGDPVTVPAGAFSSTVDQATADADALAAGTAALSCGVAAQLQGLVWEMAMRWINAATDPADVTSVIIGSPGHLYTVAARIRGVVELKDYGSGIVVAPGTGGYCLNDSPGIYPGNVSPFPLKAYTDPYTGYHPAPDGVLIPGGSANEYLLLVSDPVQIYVLNANIVAGIGPVYSHPPLDYPLTFQARTGATVTLRARSIDGNAYYNGWINPNPPYNWYGFQVVPTPPAINVTQPYPGQFMQMDVLSVS